MLTLIMYPELPILNYSKSLLRLKHISHLEKTVGARYHGLDVQSKIFLLNLGDVSCVIVTTSEMRFIIYLCVPF